VWLDQRVPADRHHCWWLQRVLEQVMQEQVMQVEQRQRQRQQLQRAGLLRVPVLPVQWRYRQFRW
jgi:hypothetical protein